MDKQSRIYIAGHNGLVGSAIVRCLQREGYRQLVWASRETADLRDRNAVNRLFEAERPEFVFLAAARVGGILANAEAPAQFLYDNLAIEMNAIDAAYRYRVRKILFLGSSCIYPKFALQPIKEEYLLGGPLEPTNEGYAIAKIAGIKLMETYRRQYGLLGISLMPANLYGEGDNFDLRTSHVLPALVRKFHEAVRARANTVTIWGTGNARREFLHVDDLAEAAVFLMNRNDGPDLINVGTGEDVSICELARLLKQISGFRGEIVFDGGKPDGTPRKLLDVSRVRALGWKPKVPLCAGVEAVYRWYEKAQKCEEVSVLTAAS